ncbi:MAG: HAD-IB family hydrolase [Aldersonia sp.]|nr:HAD-IB family hydrolase [Aldersonia sp.]
MHGYSGALFYQDLVMSRKVSPGQLVRTLRSAVAGIKTEEEFEGFLADVLRSYAGHTTDEMQAIANRLFTNRLAGQIYPQAWQLVRAHDAAGHTLVVASSATSFQIEPAARELGIDNVLSTPVELRDGVGTGRIAGRTLWGEGKAAAVADFAATHGVDLQRSYGYANGTEDEAFLAEVGIPIALNPDKGLTRKATERNWPILRLRPRGNAGPREVAHTVAGYAGMFTGGYTGAVRNILGGRRAMVDGMTRDAAELTLLGAGVRINVVGKKNAESPRPAVFIFNHQSEFDLIVVGHVLRGGFTGLVKKEMATNPVFGPMLRFAGATFIDRQSEKAREKLGPVVDTLKSGTSVIVAPEGTRSLTPRLGQFKKGAFHIAMQAGVPIIPIVIRNAGEIYWRNARLIRQGTIDVAVLDPIDVSGWSLDNLDDEVERVRQLFADTMLDWPKE